MSLYKILRFFGCQNTYFKTCPFLPEQYLHHAVELFTYQVNRCAYIFSGCILQQGFCYSFILLRIMQIGI